MHSGLLWLYHKESLLPTKISQTSIGIKAWIRNDIQVKKWYAINYPCPDVNGGLVMMPLVLGG